MCSVSIHVCCQESKCILNKSVCLHNICMCVCIFGLYIHTHTHAFIYIHIFINIFMDNINYIYMQIVSKYILYVCVFIYA